MTGQESYRTVLSCMLPTVWRLEHGEIFPVRYPNVGRPSARIEFGSIILSSLPPPIRFHDRHPSEKFKKENVLPRTGRLSRLALSPLAIYPVIPREKDQAPIL
ncbi:hypothetical protein N7463_000550 [Penicillium fimorum]|uniref:Uncharacterized protein n=1 Tax=Penicillium fimorum TaxID=1882269 RepID=A0A9W9Y4J1_9EURO|nr:hypothetical protein N7463_000550 [Penicillium fimorum]